MEDVFSMKPTNPRKAKSVYRPAGNPRQQKYDGQRNVAALAKKAVEKQRTIQRNKDVASKEAKSEANIPEVVRLVIDFPVGSDRAVVVIHSQRPKKAAPVVDAVSFDDCVVVFPPLPTLSPIALAENKFELLNSLKEEEVVTLEAPREGLVTRVVRAVKNGVKRVLKFAKKLVKSAIKAARNVVSL
jgi:hypothetical protein